jgi:hypothetical protein
MMVSRRKRARIRYLGEWYERYTHMDLPQEGMCGLRPSYYDSLVPLEADSDR